MTTLRGAPWLNDQLEKVEVLVTYLCPTLCDPINCNLSGSVKFSRQEYWSGLLFASPGDLDPGIKPGSPMLQVDFLSSEPPGEPGDTFS